MLAKAIADRQIPCLVSVTTAAARSLYPPSPYLQVWVGRLSADSLPQFLHQHSIQAIMDASHPFAVEISQVAIAAAKEFQLAYLRYERANVSNADVSNANDRLPSSFDALLASSLMTGQRVLLTIGYRSLHLFTPWQTKAILYARILPSVEALTGAIAAGFTPDRLIALRPPIHADLERALWQQWQISLVVTKASGSPGGEDTKRQIAAELGIPLVVIARPTVDYLQQTNQVAAAIAFCQQTIAEKRARK
jgi:precorrin-6A/cobalt-precorrin-6A reductase